MGSWWGRDNVRTAMRRSRSGLYTPASVDMTPTRLYFAGLGSPAATPSFDSYWDATASAAIRPMRLAEDIGTVGNVNADGSSLLDTLSTVNHRLSRQHISNRQIVTDKIVGGSDRTMTIAIGVRESNAAADAFLTFVAYICSSDGSEKRGTLYGGSPLTTVSSNPADSNYELATSNLIRTVTVPISAVSASVGDRLVVELGAVFCNLVATSYTFTFRINDDSSSDVPAINDDNSASSARCWVEITQDIFS